MADQSKSSRDKVRAHRERLRQQGLRPVAVAESPYAQEDQGFIDAVSDLDRS